MRSDFNELILTADKSKKKGTSLSAVLKLIQDLTDFEEKIQDCVDSQEIAENKQQIEAFLGEIDKMYKVLLGMAEGSIQSLRQQRLLPQEEVVEEKEDVVVKTEPTEPFETARSPVHINVPKIPKM